MEVGAFVGHWEQIWELLELLELELEVEIIVLLRGARSPTRGALLPPGGGKERSRHRARP